jgi:hypothetical protein
MELIHKQMKVITYFSFEGRVYVYFYTGLNYGNVMSSDKNVGTYSLILLDEIFSEMLIVCDNNFMNKFSLPLLISVSLSSQIVTTSCQFELITQLHILYTAFYILLTLRMSRSYNI